MSHKCVQPVAAFRKLAKISYDSWFAVRNFMLALSRQAYTSAKESVHISCVTLFQAKASAFRTPTFRPQVESLEIRLVPTTVQFSNGTFSVAESAAAATITVTLDAPSASNVSVNYSTSDYTAHAGTDYTATSGTLAINAGDTSGTITVPISGTFESSDVAFYVNLSSPSNASLGSPSSDTVTINEPTTTVEFQTSTQSVSYSAASATVEVDLSAASSLTVTVQYATSDYTAHAGTDYTATSGTLTIPAGQTSGTFNVPVSGAFESSDEAFYVNLSSPTNANLNNRAQLCSCRGGF